MPTHSRLSTEMQRGGGHADPLHLLQSLRTFSRRSDFSPTKNFHRGTVTVAGLLLGLLIGFILTPLLPPIPKAHAATTPVGTTEGKFEVTQRGSAQYTIPVFVPPGTRDMAPKLSLVYDSQAGNGMLGHGWSLGGMSIIHRCAANWQLDNFSGGVNYDSNDRFCLDGERLVNVGSNEYHTRHETWQRVLARNASDGADTSSNPAYFYVLGKDGLTLEFGRTANARIQAPGSSNVRVWALNKVMDRVGNYYTITYAVDNANGDYVPSRIDYTGNDLQGLATYNSVVFTYATRTDTPARYEAGFALRSMQRLTGIKSYAGADLAREYKLSYDNAGAAGRSRLASVQECGSDGVCLPATQFTWQNGTLGFNSAVNTYWSTNKTGDGPIGFADINGDGRQDFWGWSSDGNVKVRLANGDGSFQNAVATYWSTNKTGDAPVGFADINADGRADFYGWSSDGNIYVRMSNGDGTFANAFAFSWSTQKAFKPIGFADLNGDGRADFYGNAGGPVHIKLGNGDGTFGNSTTTDVPGNYCANSPCSYILAGLNFTDVNGDGRADLVGERDGPPTTVSENCPFPSPFGTRPATSRVERSAFVRFSLGNGSFSSEYPVFTRYHYTGPSGPCGAPNAPVGDINGDGNADVYNWLSRGNGGFVATHETVGPIYPAPGFADINGDGKDDFFAWAVSGGNVSIAWSDGAGFSSGSAIAWSTNETESPVGFTDINGDGLADFYGWRNNGNIEVRLANSVKPDLITEITNGLGLKTTVSYKPLSDPTVHARVASASYPYRGINDATYVVRTAGKSNGVGGTSTTSYAYGGYLMHLTTRQPVGFNWIQRVEPDGSWINDYYNQGVESHGTLLKSETFVPGNKLVKRVSNTWILGTSDFNRILLRLSETKEEQWGLGGSIYIPEIISRDTTTTAYDPYGFPTTTVVTRVDGRKTTTTNTYNHDITYWLLGLKTREQVTAEAPNFAPQTRTTDYAWFPGAGLMASETVEPDVPTLKRLTEYGYDAFGNRGLTRVSGVGIATRETQRLYDATGRFVVKNINALGHFETMSVDAGTGNIVQHTGPNGFVTHWTYDGFGRKLTEDRPDSTSTNTGYFTCDASCPANAVMRVSIAATGGETKWVYSDMLGREILSARTGFNGDWIYKKTVYDNLGQVTQVSHPYFAGETPHYTTTTYDRLHRPATVTAPGNRVTSNTYYGRVVFVTNPLGQQTQTWKDSEGHVINVTDASNLTTQQTFDPFGNLATVTDPAGNQTTFGYDTRGRKTSMSHPDLGSWQYEYNILDELTKQTDAKSQVTTSTYDLLGRMKSRTRPEGTTNWTYDTRPYGKGKIASAAAPSARTDTYYDSLGRTSQTTTVVGTSSYTMTTGYDAFSRPSTLTYPTGFRTRNVYDDYGHLKEVWSDSLTANVRYWRADTVDNHGRTTKETLGNGLIATRGYDATTDDLQTIQTKTAASAVVQSQSYGFDAIRNLKTRTWYDGAANRTESFGYDGINRLTSATGPVNKSFGYNAAGNITSKSDVGTYTYPPVGSPRPHAVTSTAGAVNATFAYDANGNMLTGNGRTHTWTSFNKLKTAVKGATATFAYGADDQRVSKVISGLGTPTTHSVGKLFERYAIWTSLSTDRHYIFAGDNLVAIYNTGNATSASTRYYHKDHLGSVDGISDEAGNITARLSYDTWGKRRNANGTDTATPVTSTRGYTGLEHDDELALINMEAREQEPFLARFISPDPLGAKGDPNPYAYANNNPLKYVDPAGTSSVSLFQQNGGSYYDSSGYFREEWVTRDLYATRNEFDQIFETNRQYWWDTEWSQFNAQTSLLGNSGPASTSFNGGWNGGVGSGGSPFDAIGAGNATGLPSNFGLSNLSQMPNYSSDSSSWSVGFEACRVLCGGLSLSRTNYTFELTGSFGVGYGGGMWYQPDGGVSRHARNSGSGFIATTSYNFDALYGLGPYSLGYTGTLSSGNAVTTPVGGGYYSDDLYLGYEDSTEFGFRFGASGGVDLGYYWNW